MRLSTGKMRWIGLLVLLAALLGGWIRVMHTVDEVPPERYWHTYKFDANDSSIVRTFDIPADSNDDRELKLNLISGEIRSRTAPYNPFRRKMKMGECELLAYGSTRFVLRPGNQTAEGNSEPQVIECPGERHVVVNNRYLLGNDEDGLYVWDGQQPAETHRSFTNPLGKPLEVLPIYGRDHMVAWPTRTVSYVMDGSGSIVTLVEDPDLDDQTEAAETVLDNAPNAPVVKQVYLLSLAGEQDASGNHCKVLASWQALNNGTQNTTFPEPLAAVTDQFVVTVAPTADALEYRSVETGGMEFVSPVPQGLDLANDRWRFSRGQLQVGHSGANWVFDLQTQLRIDIPGGEAFCIQRYPEDQLSIYWKWAVRNDSESSLLRILDPRRLFREAPLSREGEWIIMDERLGKPALVISSRRGYPVRIDDERLAFCSPRYSLSAEIFNWKAGETEKWIAPRRWLAPVLCVWMFGSIGWATLWLIQSRLSEAPLWTDALGLVLPFLMLTSYWLLNFGNLEWRASKLDGLLRHSVAAVFCASLLVLFVMLKSLPYRSIVKVLLSTLCLVCMAGILRLATVELPPVPIPTGDDFVILPSYDDFWSAHGFLLLSASVVAMALSVLRRRGFYITSGNWVEPHHQLSDMNPSSAMTDSERDPASPSTRHRSSGTRIVDWMLVTAVMAIGLQIYSSACRDWEYMLDGLFFFWMYLDGLIESILLSVLSLFAVITAFSASKLRFVAGFAVSLCLAIWSLFHPIAEFVLARTPWGPWSESILLHFVVTTAWLVFLFCYLLRRHGWCFRTSQPKDSRETRLTPIG